MESFVHEVIDETKGTEVGNSIMIGATASRVGTMEDKDKSKEKRTEDENEGKHECEGRYEDRICGFVFENAVALSV
jgi:hypothetical protein